MVSNHLNSGNLHALATVLTTEADPELAIQLITTLLAAAPFTRCQCGYDL